MQRLRTLIERSKIYTSILADKLAKQQSEARERGEEIDRRKRLSENKVKKEAAIEAGPTRKSSRTATVESSEHTTEHVSPKKPTRAAVKNAPKSKKGSKLSIASYFDKKELDTDMNTAEALEAARKEEEEIDSGVTAVTKPSASARQPELVTGCVLRDYQVDLQPTLLILARWSRMAD